jgi:hypothetical protein
MSNADVLLAVMRTLALRARRKDFCWERDLDKKINTPPIRRDEESYSAKGVGYTQHRLTVALAHSPTAQGCYLWAPARHVRLAPPQLPPSGGSGRCQGPTAAGRSVRRGHNTRRRRSAAPGQGQQQLCRDCGFRRGGG